MPDELTPADGLSWGRVLVVDDEPANRELLRDVLRVYGYEVREAEDGLAALAAAAADPPDVVLLDVMMPRLNGYEVCRQLKAAPATAAVPVLLLTSLTAREERLQGIRAGANDFLSKPLDTADLILRVRNAVAGKRLYDQLRHQVLRLQELEALRDSLVHMIIHDLRSPFTAISLHLQLMEMDPAGGLSGEQRSGLAESRLLINQITEMMNAVLDVNRLEAGRMPLLRTGHLLGDLVEQAVRTLGPRAAARVQVAPALVPQPVTCDRGLVVRVLVNLLGNALKFSPEHTAVQVGMDRDDTGLRVYVRDAGPGIPEDRQHLIFEKYAQVDPQLQRGPHAVGLGLTFCRMAIEAHGGTIGVDSTPGSGSTFWFRLPLPPPPAAGAIPESGPRPSRA